MTSADAIDYHPAFPYELVLNTPQKRGNLFRWGDPIALTVGCAFASQATTDKAVQLTLRVTAYPDKVLSSEVLTLVPGEERNITLMPKRNGLLRVELLPVDSRLAAAQELIAAVLPEPRPTGAESFFGAHINVNPYFINYARQLGFKWVRMHDASWLTKWTAAQPQKGQFVWYDQQVDALKKAGLFILGMPDCYFRDVPAWATGANSTPGNILNLEEFEKHCRALAEHYRGRIDHWEIWNEPWIKFFFPGTPQQFREVCLAGARGIRAGNPAATRLGICSEMTGTGLIRAVGPEVWKNLDAVSVHMYFQNITGNGKLSFADEVRALLQSIGPGTLREVWNTEGTLGGAGRNSFYKFLNVAPQLNEDALAFGSRMWMESAKSGIAKTFIYTIHQSDTYMYYGGLKMMIGFDRSVTPGAVATAVCAWCIDGLKHQPCAELAGVKQAYFVGPDRQTWAVYDDQSEPGTRKLDLRKLPAQFRILDTLGNDPRLDADGAIEIGIKPLYAIGAPSEKEFAARCSAAIE